MTVMSSDGTMKRPAAVMTGRGPDSTSHAASARTGGRMPASAINTTGAAIATFQPANVHAPARRRTTSRASPGNATYAQMKNALPSQPNSITNV